MEIFWYLIQMESLILPKRDYSQKYRVRNVLNHQLCAKILINKSLLMILIMRRARVQQFYQLNQLPSRQIIKLNLQNRLRIESSRVLQLNHKTQDLSVRQVEIRVYMQTQLKKLCNGLDKGHTVKYHNHKSSSRAYQGSIVESIFQVSLINIDRQTFLKDHKITLNLLVESDLKLWPAHKDTQTKIAVIKVIHEVFLWLRSLQMSKICFTKMLKFLLKT